MSIEGAYMLTEHSHPVRTVHFTAPGTTYADQLLVGSDDRSVTLHDVKDVGNTRTCTTIASLQGQEGWILDVESSGDGRIVATAASDHQVFLWDLAQTPKMCVAVVSDKKPIWAISWRRDVNDNGELPSTRLLIPGSAFVSGGDDGVIHWYRNAGAASSS